MLVNKPMCDWLTLTTFEERAFYNVDVQIPKVGEERRLQYKGHSWEGVFAGSALQGGKKHYMVQSSGEQAHRFLDWVRTNTLSIYDWNVTRIDLQITIDLPEDWNTRKVYDSLVAWDGPGRPRKIAVVMSGDGNDTIYIGSRTSDRFTRLYVKPLDGGHKALRFETEYKGDHAHTVYAACYRDEDALAPILAQELNDLPAINGTARMLFLKALGVNGHKPAIKRTTGQNSTLDWLRDTVTPSLERLANDHDTHDAIVALVQQWYNSFCSGV